MKDKWNKRLFGCSMIMAVIAAFGIVLAAWKFFVIAPAVSQIANMPPPHKHHRHNKTEDEILGEGPSDDELEHPRKHHGGGRHLFP